MSSATNELASFWLVTAKRLMMRCCIAQNSPPMPDVKATIAIMKVNGWHGHCVGLVQYSSVQVTVCQINVVENKLKYGQSFCYGGFVESLRSRQSLVTVPFVFLRRLGNNLQSQSVNKI